MMTFSCIHILLLTFRLRLILLNFDNQMTVPFQYEWLDKFFKEIATFVFFVLTGYKFRPAPDNPYLNVPREDDEDMDVVSVIFFNFFRVYR